MSPLFAAAGRTRGFSKRLLAKPRQSFRRFAPEMFFVYAERVSFPPAEFFQERFGIPRRNNRAVFVPADQVLRPVSLRGDARKAAVQRLRHHEAEAFLQGREREHGTAAKRLRQRALRYGAVKVKPGLSVVSREVLLRFGKHGAVEVNAPIFPAREGESIQKGPGSLSQADLAWKDDVKTVRLAFRTGMKYLGIRRVRHYPYALGRDAESREVIAPDARRDAMVIRQRVFVVGALEIGVVVGTGFLDLQADAPVFGLHDPHPLANGAARVVEHGGYAQFAGALECPSALPRHGVDEIGLGQRAAHPAIEPFVLPEVKRPRVGPRPGGEEALEAVDNRRAETVRLDRHPVAVRQFPERITGVVSAEFPHGRKFPRDRVKMARIRGGDGDFHNPALGLRTNSIQVRYLFQGIGWRAAMQRGRPARKDPHQSGSRKTQPRIQAY